MKKAIVFAACLGLVGCGDMSDKEARNAMLGVLVAGAVVALASGLAEDRAERECDRWERKNPGGECDVKFLY